MGASSGAEARRPAAEITKRRILDAAIELFSAHSFDGASTRDIATLAGVTQPLLNHHFGSKLDLWQAAVDDLFDRLRATLRERTFGLRGVDEATTAELLIREFVSFSAANPQLHRIILQESKADGPRLDWLVDRHVRPLYEQTVALFARLAETGHMAPFAPAHAYYLLTGAAPTMFVLAPECRRLTGIDPFDPEVVEAHADAVVSLLFRRP